jgi:hypothetical protein
MNRRVALGVLGVMGLVAAACGGSAGPQGPKGDTGAKGDPGAAGTGAGATPSISGIEPPLAFLARASHVTISGYATSWTDATKVDFGAGITVSNVHAASPTAIVADLAIDKTAALGPRDVNVDKETYKQAFAVKPPATVSLQGALAQGAIAVANVKLEDTSTPFDTTATQDPLTGALTYTNLAFTLGAGLTQSSILSATNASVQFIVLVDVDAKAGASDFDLVSGPAGDAANDVEFPAPGGLTVAARAATALGATAASGTIKNAYDSALYSYAPSAAGQILDVTADSTASGANPSFALLPKSGHFADLLGFFQPAQPGSPSAKTLLPASTDPYYAIYWDNGGTTGAYTLGATSTAPAATHATATGDGTKTTAIAAAALPFVLTGGSLADATSQDWVKVTAAAGDVNKSLRVQTVGDELTDVAATVYKSDGTTAVGTAIETGGTLDGTVTIPAAGTYYVAFAAGQIFDATHGTYSAILRIQ